MPNLQLEWVVLATLLAASACFSATETALFSLSPHERRRAGSFTERLLDRPRALLMTLRGGKLAVGIAFFAFALRLDVVPGPWGPWITGLGALWSLVFLGEVAPRSLALCARVPVARIGALPFGTLSALLAPLQRLADRVLELVYRALGEAARAERAITADALGEVLERSAEQGLILESEAEFLAGVVELGEVRVREVMTPRVDMLLIDLADDRRDDVLQRAVEERAPWITIVSGSPDRVLGRVRVRELLLAPEADLRTLLEPVVFVPEVASLLQLLQFLRREGLAQAIVVDEWGGTAGLVRLEDVFERIVGDLPVEGERSERAVEALGDGRFRVAGSLSIRDWNERFGHRVVPTEFETVGGFVTALLARIPRPGDAVESGGLRFEVDAVERGRIRTLAISLAPAPLETVP
jgi:CBS domain containing-hemolysin-like protein